MATNTLTSLAMLKVNIDRGTDYLDYLRPFILQVLVDYKPDPVTGSVVREHIHEDFGLEIPERTIQIVLRCLSRSYSIDRESGVYRLTGELPDPRLTTRQVDANRHITSVLHGLREFSEGTICPLESDDAAVTAISAFLAEFDVTCLRAYLRGTAIPKLEGSHLAEIVLVSEYVQHIQRADLAQFQSFLVFVEGNMLANALLCPDLAHATHDYRGVTFYLDTPLLVQRLGLEGEPKEAATIDLIALLVRLNAKIATFEHSREELRGVLLGAASNLEAPGVRGAIVAEARIRGTTRSDLILLAETIDERLLKADIELQSTPGYTDDYQIDETQFENVLDDWVGYRNPSAKLYDINSVRSVYVIRAKRRSPSVEKARAVFVTSNSSFASAAWEYGKQFEESQDVSSVITDFTLANTAWLKAPVGASTIPRTQLLAFAYAALEPSDRLLDKFMLELDRLESQGDISARDHQLLRSSPQVYPELMHFTLGDDAALTAETVTQTLERVSDEIKSEESARLRAEQEAHEATQKALFEQQTQNRTIADNLYWRCLGRARTLARAVSTTLAIFIAIFFILGLLAEAGLFSIPSTISWLFIIGSAALALLAYMNLVFGSSLNLMHRGLKERLLNLLLKREAKVTGIDLSAYLE